MPTLQSRPNPPAVVEAATRRVAGVLHSRFGRRSFLALVGRLGLSLAGFSLLEAVELAAPSVTALASHCAGGYHAGPPCTHQTSCSANGLAAGQYWLSCCSGGTGGPCGDCFSGWKYTKFQDCCASGACGGKTSGVYCPSGTCFSCKIQSCTSTTCHGPTCLAPAA